MYTSTTPSRRRRLLPVVLLAAVLVAGLVVVFLVRGHGQQPGQGQGARSVIFINGDGMSAAHREAGRLDQAGVDGELAMNSLPVTGLQTTDPRDPDHAITDSAAAASAWSTGEKTHNGAVSVDVDDHPLPTLGAQARQAGLATGLVTTASVTDATPAAFFSNAGDRGAQDDIARQYLEDSKPQVVLGGGEDWWLPAGDEGAYPPGTGGDPQMSRSTEGDLIGQAKDAGYEYVSTADELAAAHSDRLLGLFANEEMFRYGAGGGSNAFDPAVPLADMASKALDVLSRDQDGFFLLIEEEGIDAMSHDNDGELMLQAMRSLDAAVTVAEGYVDTHPDTLLIVTGDHDCGGLTIENVDPGRNSLDAGEDGPFDIADSHGGRFVLDWTTKEHTGAPTVVTARGPGSEDLIGYYPNTHLHEVMRTALLG